jgi:hypothetical protein
MTADESRRWSSPDGFCICKCTRPASLTSALLAATSRRCASSPVCAHLREDAGGAGRPDLPWVSPKVRISTPSTVRRCDRPCRLPSFVALSGVAVVLAAGLISRELQAHLALARPGEQPPSSTPTSLPVRTKWSSAYRGSDEMTAPLWPSSSQVIAIAATVGTGPCLRTNVTVLARDWRSGELGALS